MTNTTIKMSPQGQVTIPKDIREITGMEAGSELIVITNLKDPKGITIFPKPISWVDAVARTGKGIWGKNVDQYVDKLRDEW